jgi:hypothetical protein
MAMMTQNSSCLSSFFSLDGKERDKPACRRQGKDQVKILKPFIIQNISDPRERFLEVP